MPRFRRPSLQRLARRAWLRHVVVALALLLATGNALAALAASPALAATAVSAHHAHAGSSMARGCHAPAKAGLPACPCCAGDHCACLAGTATPALPSTERLSFAPAPRHFGGAAISTALRPGHSSPPLRPPAS